MGFLSPAGRHRNVHLEMGSIGFPLESVDAELVVAELYNFYKVFASPAGRRKIICFTMGSIVPSVHLPVAGQRHRHAIDTCMCSGPRVGRLALIQGQDI